jgi:hypothetical protein
MARPVFYGWKIVIVCFLIALLSFGIGFYGPGIYIVSLQERHGWSTSLISRKNSTLAGRRCGCT